MIAVTVVTADTVIASMTLNAARISVTGDDAMMLALGGQASQ